MLPVLHWELVYADKSRLSSHDGEWSDAPPDGVQALILYHGPPYRTISYAEDTYSLPGESEVKRGSWMPTEDFAALIKSLYAERYR